MPNDRLQSPFCRFSGLALPRRLSVLLAGMVREARRGAVWVQAAHSQSCSTFFLFHSPSHGRPSQDKPASSLHPPARQTLMDNPGLTLMGRLPMLLPSQNLFRYLH